VVVKGGSSVGEWGAEGVEFGEGATLPNGEGSEEWAVPPSQKFC